MTNDERDSKLNEIHTAVTLIADKVNSHNDDLYGNGKPGIKMDVDRLKQCHKRSSKISWLVIVAVIALISRVVFVFVTK